ncbi:MAG: M24 family metallopeptidase [Candidatus Caldarchaeum sp.]|nr:M24 family metallopeptidase [Candidatus Caldarchaeum sp.]
MSSLPLDYSINNDVSRMNPLRAEVFEQRVEKVAERLRSSSVEAVILCSPANVYYFTGYRGGVLYASADGTLILFSSLPVSTPLADRVEIVEKLGRRDPVMMALEYLGDRRMSLGYDTMTVEAYQAVIRSAPSVSMVSVKDLMYELRQVKSEEEVSLLRKACETVSTTMEVVRQVISYGTTVADIRRAVADSVYRAGAELAYNPRVSFGDDTFLNSDSPAEREVRRDELIKLQIGVVVEHYVAGLSRTYFYGEKPPEKLVKFYSSLLKLKDEVKSNLAPWSSAISIYDKCRSFALTLGFEPSTLTYFGKGVGLEEAEPPFIHAGSADIVREGAVVNVGPDLLIPGRFGLSVSDVYHVSAAGPQPLTEASLELALG